MDASQCDPSETYIGRLVGRLALADADRPVLRHAEQDITASDLLTAVHRQARALAAMGVGRGSLVALLAPNTPAALSVRYAANLLGAGTVYLSVPPLMQNRAALIAQMAPSLLVVFAETAALLPEDAAVQVAAFGVSIAGAARLDHLAEAQSAAPLACAARPADLGVIVSSGGTTGIPHGSWRSFAAYDALIAAPSPPDRRQLVNGRLAYLSQTLVDVTLLGGGVVVLHDGFDAAETLEAIERERITHLFLVEPQLFEMMDHPDVARRNLSSLRQVVHIGASAPPALRLRARERLGAVVAHTYGASDMGLVSMLPAEAHDPARPDVFLTAGHVMPGVELRLRRTDGMLAVTGEPGVVEVRSSAVANGYRNRPEEEAKAFHDGWFHSGDLARLDETGLVQILGRAADIVEVDGVLVTPTMMEEVLCRLADVRYASVVAAPAARRWVAACIPWASGRVEPGRCRKALAQAFGAAVADAVVVLAMDRVPTTEQGKPDRVAILRLAEEC